MRLSGSAQGVRISMSHRIVERISAAEEALNS